MKLLALATCLILLLGGPAWALRKGGNDWPINLGITGAFGDLKPDAPKTIVVTEILPATPAAGVLKVADRIIGAGGQRFTVDHKFGYGMDKFGYEGPLMDFGNALEVCQTSGRGVLQLDVKRGAEVISVKLELDAGYGGFSSSYPFDCKKTDRILDEAYAELLAQQKPDGSWSGRPHINTFAVLALLSSGRPEFEIPVEKIMRWMAAQTDSMISYGGLDCWKYGLYGMCLSEYFLATKEDWVLPELQEINEWLQKAQFTAAYKKEMGAGGWGHRPTLRPEGNGYGPICVITAQAMAAWALMEPCGIEIDRDRFELAHRFIVKGTNNIGYVWYKDGNGGDDKYADMGRTGISALAHALSPFDRPAHRRQAKVNAECIGQNPLTFFDTHGSPLLGMAWTALGAAQDEGAFRKLMDSHRWFFNLSQCPDGRFYYMPNRDGNRQDFSSGKHLSATATTALILSIRHRSLRCMGK